MFNDVTLSTPKAAYKILKPPNIKRQHIAAKRKYRRKANDESDDVPMDLIRAIDFSKC